MDNKYLHICNFELGIVQYGIAIYIYIYIYIYIAIPYWTIPSSKLHKIVQQ